MEGMFLTDILLLENILDGISEPEPLKLSFLEYMTDNFSENRIAGRGGFGVVYKGDLKNRNVAVKKLTFTNNAEKEFDREIRNLLRVSHKNIVRLLGYCNDRICKYLNVANPGEPERISSVYTEERIMCFEYISNGSLTAHIHDELRGLKWHTRYNIIKGICQALDYLHNTKRLVHRDLKPDNILIDNLMAPKIADLGISKLLNDGLSKYMTTNPNATWEYAAPEFKDRVVSVKYDIYSLGIIIIEIVTGFRRAPDLKTVLTRWRHRWNKSNEPLRYQQVAKCLEIGQRCKNDKPRKRPSILKIIKDLDDVDGGNGAVGLEIPCWNELLWVEPPELFFPFQINKQISCSLELHNNADAYMVFFIKTDSDMQYDMDPSKGVIQPRSHLSVSITLLEQAEAPEKMWNADEFTIKSKKVNEGITAEEITKKYFSKKSGNIVDKVRIGVVFDAQRRAACMVEEEPKEHQSLDPLATSDSQVSGGTSSEAESTTQSVCDLDKKFCRYDPGQSIIPSKSSINSGPYSGHAEASRSTHTNNYLSAAEPMAMTFQELHYITDGFSEKRLLGKGGFGILYKGVFDNGDVIAVKKFHNKPGLVEEQFKNELLVLLTVKHPNIIRLVGYCSEAKHIVNEHKGKKDLFYGEERALCLEYLQGGNLEELLSDKSCELDWEERYRIIKGICLGLKHLHTGSSDPIYHLDLKPANILLDSNRIPKIGDFGLSRLRDSMETFVTKTYSGTNLYMPPEYMHRQEISSKFDVFSLGVIMIQIIAGPDGYYNYKCVMSQEEFIDHVTENWSKRLQAKTMSPEELLEIQRCIELALRCVKGKQSKRPSITEIVEELNMISKCTPFDAHAGDESSVALSNS